MSIDYSVYLGPFLSVKTDLDFGDFQERCGIKDDVFRDLADAIGSNTAPGRLCLGANERYEARPFSIDTEKCGVHFETPPDIADEAVWFARKYAKEIEAIEKAGFEFELKWGLVVGCS